MVRRIINGRRKDRVIGSLRRKGSSLGYLFMVEE